ncbi:MAG: zinc ribbon domain-containing protein [Candidatus Gracilibacteria bacterium]|nr:zinc ribbon domain-containing protein [Candidatus Gracilibacteria bacterium]
MPRHDFKCLKCGHVFELELPAGHQEEVKCLACGHPETQKLLSSPNVIFKGTGFYKTDARSKCDSCGDGSCPMRKLAEEKTKHE